MLNLFCSDLHLDPTRPGARALFGEFLAGPARRADALFVLGDLFEYWAGDDDGDTFNASVCADLRACADVGVSLFFLPGNRDFLVGEGFARASGARLIADGAVVRVGSRRVLLLHGDTLCTDDAEYQDFRARVRGDRWRREFLSRPVAERRQEIEALRSRSEAEKRRKPAPIMDVNPEAVVAAMEESAADAMIHGHTHRPARHETDIGGRKVERWVLPEWSANGGYLRCEDDDWRMVPVP